MALLAGVPVILYEKTQIGTDEFNRAVFEETPVTIDNVLITPVSSTNTDIVDSTDLNGKHLIYELSLPKGDDHEWEDRKVEFFGQMWHTYGIPREYIESLVPLEWNKKVQVERYG